MHHEISGLQHRIHHSNQDRVSTQHKLTTQECDARFQHKLTKTNLQHKIAIQDYTNIMQHNIVSQDCTNNNNLGQTDGTDRVIDRDALQLIIM